MDKDTALTAVAGVLAGYAAWNTFERIHSLLTLMQYMQLSRARGTGFVPALSAENLASILFSVAAWWGVAALAWLMRAQAQDLARATAPRDAGEQSEAEWPLAPS